MPHSKTTVCVSLLLKTEKDDKPYASLNEKKRKRGKNILDSYKTFSFWQKSFQKTNHISRTSN